MNTKQRHLFFFAAVFAVLASPVRTNAQTTYGSIVGTVTDPSGSAVAGTEVVLTNLGTGEKRTEPTNSDGLYQFVNILPVQYSVSIEKPGFKRVVRTPITVETETTTRIDLTLQVGEVSQTVELTAQTPLLQPETSSLGTVVEQKQLNELPLNGRNPMNLVARRWCHRVNRNRTRMARIRSRGAIIRSAAVWRTRA